LIEIIAVYKSLFGPVRVRIRITRHRRDTIRSRDLEGLLVWLSATIPLLQDREDTRSKEEGAVVPAVLNPSEGFWAKAELDP
jgi:hypothetical protein